jgi:hypothetical protein
MPFEFLEYLEFGGDIVTGVPFDSQNKGKRGEKKEKKKRKKCKKDPRVGFLGDWSAN